MADNLPTVWPVEAHTLAKHAILKRYFEAWCAILSRQSRRVPRGSEEMLFIDGFAGPGEYEKGELGSPIIALETALQHSVRFPVPVRFLFIEKSEDRWLHLREVLNKYSQQISQSSNVRLSPPRQGECDSVLAGMLDEHERKGIRFGPALAFLDQFGYSAVSMELITRILGYPQCEVLSYLDYKDMNRWITDPSKRPSFTRTYGGEEWRKAIGMPEVQRRVFLLDEYKKALRARANAKYVWSFAMFDSSPRLLYWLIFCTGNIRGLEEMKKAMRKVDRTGGFRFSDEDNPQQLRLLNDAYDDTWLAEELFTKLAGRTLTVKEIHEHVLTETPCYLFKGALKILEPRSDPAIEVLNPSPNRRRGTFYDEDRLVRFRKRDLFSEPTIPVHLGLGVRPSITLPHISQSQRIYRGQRI